MNEKVSPETDEPSDDDPTAITGEASFGVHEDFVFNNNGDEESADAANTTADENAGDEAGDSAS